LTLQVGLLLVEHGADGRLVLLPEVEAAVAQQRRARQPLVQQVEQARLSCRGESETSGSYGRKYDMSISLATMI